jgi:molecular chaperone GrpE
MKKSKTAEQAKAPEAEAPVEPVADAASEDATPDIEVEDVEPEAIDPLTALRDENASLQDRLLRLQADFENFRKRTQRERSELYVRANEEIVEQLLPVLDTFELGMANAEQSEADSSMVEGFQLVYQQTLATLKKFGLEPLHAEGEPFDPHHHEAITHLPSPDVPADHVMTQTRRGYRLGDRLLRAAQVVVSSGSPPAEEGS